MSLADRGWRPLAGGTPTPALNRQLLSIAQPIGDRTDAPAGRTFRWEDITAGEMDSDTVHRYRNRHSPDFDWRDLLFLLVNHSERGTSLPSEAMSRKELFLRACRGEAVPRLPVWMMRQAGRYLPEYREIRAKRAFLEVCKTPELAIEVSLQPFRRLGVDAIIVFSDILIPAEAMGMKLELGDAGPNLPGPVRTERDIEALRIFDAESERDF